jgi:parallel beta-helix repeat protein
MKREKPAAIFFAAAMLLGLAATAGAVDGTIEINQAKVLAAGGFPYVISTANTSYRLTGSLTVPAITNGILVKAAGVTIDLNGFSIVAAVTPGSSTFGINASKSELTVENGMVSGFGDAGISTADDGIVRNVHATSNGIGILCSGNACVISGNTANNNTSYGISCSGSGCLASGNTAFGNNTGIVAIDATTGYGGNVLNNTTNVNGGTSLGHNLCSGVVC